MDAISTIRTEALRFADVLATTTPDARCPTCPDCARTEADIAAVDAELTARCPSMRSAPMWLPARWRSRAAARRSRR